MCKGALKKEGRRGHKSVVITEGKKVKTAVSRRGKRNLKISSCET